MKSLTIAFNYLQTYGAVLQVYAFRNYIIFSLMDKEITDESPNEVAEHKEVRLFPKPFNLKKLLTNTIGFPIRKMKYAIFNSFIRNKLILSDKKYSTYEDIERDSVDYNYRIARK